jgi:hypothetical protein
VVLVAVRQRHPALATLTLHVGLDRFALRLDAPELCLACDGLSAVDRDADLGSWCDRLHFFDLPFNPKNSRPLQREPVTAFATADREP